MHKFQSIMTTYNGALDFLTARGEDLSIQSAANGFQDAGIPWEIISDRDNNPMIFAWYQDGSVEIAYTEID